MKCNYHISIFFFTILVIQISSLAQEPEKFDILNDNIESMLPPLETIIDSAIANNSSIKSSDLETRLKEFKLETDQKLWIKNLGVQTDVRYGTINNFSSSTEGQTPSLSVIQSNSFNYGVGAFVKLPIHEFLNRKNLISSDKTEIEKAKSMADFQRTELRQIVIRQYNDLLLKHHILKIKLKNIETSRINMQMVEKGFLNGVLSIAEYTNQSEASTSAEINLESSRMDFKTAYMIFEEIVGVKFNLLKTIP